MDADAGIFGVACRTLLDVSDADACYITALLAVVYTVLVVLYAFDGVLDFGPKLYCLDADACRTLVSDDGFVRRSIGLGRCFVRWSCRSTSELPVDIYCIDLDAGDRRAF